MLDYNPENSGTIFDAILNVYPILQYYNVDNPFTIIFGKAIIHDLYVISSPGELDLLVYPINYGLLWFIITLSGIVLSLKYSHQLIKYSDKSNIEYILGLSFLGFIVVMLLSNLHYPHYDDHGIIELLFIMLGVLTSMREMIFYPLNQFSNN